MTIEVVDARRVRVVLQAADLNDFGVDYSMLVFDSAAITPILGVLLEAVRCHTGFSVSHGKLFVEVYPGSAGGCIICFTRLFKVHRARRYRVKSTPYLFCFAQAEDLLAACHALTPLHIGRSCLYAHTVGLVLSLGPLEARQWTALRVLREFARPLGNGWLLEGVCKEHSRILCESDAITQIAQIG